MNNFMCFLHMDKYIDILKIKKMIISKTNNVIEYNLKYLDHHRTYKLNCNNDEIIKFLVDHTTYFSIWDKKIISNMISKNNHFYFNIFDVSVNYKKLKIEMDRLIQYRDKYTNIHIHLDNNDGGDLVPVHLILRCLCGKKEKWMKDIRKVQQNKEILKMNCWDEEDKNSPNYEVVKKLNLDVLPNYETKYKGNIHLYMSKENRSSAWFFITYLIYAFSNKINRSSKKCYGQRIRYGTIESNQLILLGHSGTTSGDGNSVLLKDNDIEIDCPTEQFLSCSIKQND